MPPKKLPSKEILSLYFRYEKESGKFFWKEGITMRHGVVSLGKEEAGTLCNGYVVLNFKHKEKKYRCKAHRVAFFLETGEEPIVIDHINRIRNDNRIENLRAADHTLNCINQGLRKDNKTNIKGVNWHKSSRRWVAQIQVEKKKHWIGSFLYKQEAEDALNRFKLKNNLE